MRLELSVINQIENAHSWCQSHGGPHQSRAGSLTLADRPPPRLECVWIPLVILLAWKGAQRMSAKKSMVSGLVRINGPRAIACAAAALVAACGGNAANELSARARGVEVVTANGKSINGKSINGKSINGKSINGSMLNGKSINGTDLTDVYLMSVQLESPQIDGAPVVGASLHGTVFTGSLGGTNLNPADFARAVFHGQLSDGTNLNVRFDQYALLSTAGGDLNSYAVSYET